MPFLPYYSLSSRARPSWIECNGNADKVEKLFRSNSRANIADEGERARERATIDVIVSLDAFSFVEIDDETARLVVACVSDKEFFHGF